MKGSMVYTGMLVIEVARNGGIDSRMNSHGSFQGMPAGLAGGFYLKRQD